MVRVRDRRLLILNAQGRRIGESHPRAKLTELDVDLVLRLREAGLSLAGIASKFDDYRRIKAKYVAKLKQLKAAA